MTAISRAALATLLANKVITGNNATTAQNIRDFENTMIDSFVSAIDDPDVAGGYMKIAANGIVNTGFIKKITPTGQFLKDDGTWASPAGVTASNGLTLTGSNVALGGTLVNDTVINGASKSLFLGFTGSLLDNLSTVAATSTTITTANGALQSYFYGDSSYLVIGVDNSSSNTIEIFNAGSAVANNGSNNSLIVSDGITSKGLVYALDYKANFTNESLVSKRYVDAAIATVTGFTAGSVIYSNGTTLTQNNANFFWDNANVLLYIGANSGAYANTKLQVNANTNNFAQINFINTNAGASASSDYVATADNGTNTTNYIDLGINSSGFSDAAFTIVGALGSYLYSNGGDLAVGTQSAKKILFFTNGTLAANQRMSIDSTGLVNIGVASATNQRLVRIGQGTSIIDIGEWVTVAGKGAIYLGGATPAGGNFAVAGDTSDTYINATQSSGSLFLQVGNNTLATLNANGLSWQGIAQSSGTFTSFTFTKPNHTGQTTNTAIKGWNYVGGTRAWASTATITTQVENSWGAVTYTAGSVSTIATVHANEFNASIASTNVTITNNYSVAALGGNGLKVQTGSLTAQGIILRDLVGTATSAAIYMDVTPSASNYVIRSDGSDLLINAPVTTGTVSFNFANTNNYLFKKNTVVISPAITTGGAITNYTFNFPADTTVTTGTNVPRFKIAGASIQWNTGALATQYFNYISASTMTFLATSTATNVFSLYIDATVAGANATITNNWALGLNGSLKIESGFKLQLGNAATTGLTAGALAATTNASIVLYDSAGQAYRIPCII